MGPTGDGSPRRLLLGGMLALGVAVGLGRFAFTPILPAMQTEFGLDAAGAGWLAASNNLGYLVGAIMAGWISADRSRHRLLFWGFALLVVSHGLMAVTHSVVAWNALRLIAGLASAWIFVLASALVLPLLAATGHGRWSGLHFGGIGGGIVLAGTAIGWTVTLAGADIAWLTTTAFAAVLSLLSWFILRSAHARVPRAVPTEAGGMAFPIPLLAGAYFCHGLGYIVTGTFLVAVVRATPGLDAYANLSWVLVGLAALPSSAALSFMAERRGYVTTLVLAHCLEALGIILPAVSHHPAAVLAGAVLYGGTFLGVVGMSLAFGRIISPGHATRTMGLLTAVFGVGQILGPVLAAWMAVRGGWDRALLVAGLTVLAGVPLLLGGAWIAKIRAQSLLMMKTCPNMPKVSTPPSRAVE